MLNLCVKGLKFRPGPFRGWLISLGSGFSCCFLPSAEHRTCRRSSDLLLYPRRPAGEGVRGAQRCQRATACLLLLSAFYSWWVGVQDSIEQFVYANEQTSELSRTISWGGKKVKCLIFCEDICYDQVSSSSSQVCSIKYIIQSTRIYKTYCNSNLFRQVVFNYTYHFKKRNILSI